MLHYMPLISLETGQITGVEALLRWQHPTRGLLSPFDFLVVAEELDIINDVGRWVLRKACRQVAEWTATLPSGEILAIAVNLSARQFVSTEFLDDVGRAVADFGLPPASLALEVNERVVARDMARAMGVLTGLRALGTECTSTTSAAATRRSATFSACRWTASRSTTRSSIGWTATRRRSGSCAPSSVSRASSGWTWWRKGSRRRAT